MRRISILFRLSMYFCFYNVCARVESAAMLKLSSRHHKYGGRNATVQVRNLTKTNSRCADCYAINVNDRRRLERIVSGTRVIFSQTESVPCRISRTRSTLIAPDNFYPAATKTICRASRSFQSRAKTSLLLPPATARERSFMRIYESFARKSGRIRRRQGAPDGKNSGHFLFESL